MCNHDGDCAAEQKCCKVGCGVRCETPLNDAAAVAVNSFQTSVGNAISTQFDRKLGDCPLVAPVPGRVCASECQSDQDCPNMRKCCSNGCGTQCTYPAVATGKKISRKQLFGYKI